MAGKKEIMLNRLYAGDYLKTEGNIGHEIINLFKDDNGNNFIYAMSDGFIQNEHDNRVETILLVQQVQKSTFQILAKAEGVTQILFQQGNIDKLHEEQVNYVKNQNITYGGVRLDTLLQENIYKGEKDSKKSVYVTFKVNNVIKPIKPIYLTDKNGEANNKINKFMLKKVNFAKTSLKMYYEEGSDAYKTLKCIINNKKLWEQNNTTEKINPNLNVDNNKINFLSIIKKEYDELVFSNLLAYYFLLNKPMFVKFCKEVLKIKTMSENFKITREADDIDVLIEEYKNVIVIENKIKSGIHGKEHDVYSDKIQSQLCKYYDIANNMANGRKVKCFIFSPI